MHNTEGAAFLGLVFLFKNVDLHWPILCDKIFNPSNTINPAIIALVVMIVE